MLAVVRKAGYLLFSTPIQCGFFPCQYNWEGVLSKGGPFPLLTLGLFTGWLAPLKRLVGWMLKVPGIVTIWRVVAHLGIGVLGDATGFPVNHLTKTCAGDG